MKKIDRWLQAERIRQAQKFMIGATVLDIGCHQGDLLEKTNFVGDGIDCILTQKIETSHYTLWPGRFPEDFALKKKYDNITLLAVLEHIQIQEVANYPKILNSFLKPKGRVIITIPAKFVDCILKVLLFLKLVDGMDLEHHQAFDRSLIKYFFTSNGYQLIAEKRFELGFNHLYVFEKNEANSTD